MTRNICFFVSGNMGTGAKLQKIRETHNSFAENLLIMLERLFVALENTVDRLLGQFLRQQTDKPHNGEAADHRDGTTVDGVDGVAQKHVDNSETNAPDETCPDRGGGDATPVKTKHEGSKESTSKSSPRDTHQLGNERWRIQSNHQ